MEEIMEPKFEIKDMESLEVAYLLYKGHISGAQKEFPNIFKSIGGEIMGSPFIIYRNIDQNTKIGEFELCMPSNIKPDRKSTRLNSSHANISYAVFCLKKKKTT